MGKSSSEQKLISDESNIQKRRVTRYVETEDRTQMKILKLTLTFLTIAGCWRPLSWTTLYKHRLYNVYTVLLMLLLYTFAISQVIDVILNIGNPEEIIGILYIMIAVLVSCFKILSMWVNRKNVTDIINTLTSKPFKPEVIGEVKIRKNFDKVIRNNMLYCVVLVESTCAWIALTSLFMDFRRGQLTYKVWLPFNYSTPVLFSLTYTHQMISLVICAMINLACDCFICGLLQHVCCQLTILEYRLNRSHTWKTLRDCVQHHNHIFDFVYAVNKKFSTIIAIQFITSMLVMCSNLYQLAQTTFSPEHFPLALYTFAMVIEIFIYCWFGNEVRLKSLQLSDRIFEMNWLERNDSFKKAFIMIMNRATMPIEFTSAYFFSMNLESFVTLLKTSYSVFTLLQNSQA